MVTNQPLSRRGGVAKVVFSAGFEGFDQMKRGVLTLIAATAAVALLAGGANAQDGDRHVGYY